MSTKIDKENLVRNRVGVNKDHSDVLNVIWIDRKVLIVIKNNINLSEGHYTLGCQDKISKV